MARKRIAKICCVDSAGVGKGIAEDMEWEVYQLYDQKFESNQYVECLVIYESDKDAFFLKPVEGDFVRTRDDWELQERKYRKQ